MRRRLMLAISVLVAVTLVLAGVGGFVLIHRASAKTAEQQLFDQARALAEHDVDAVADTKLALQFIGQYRTLRVVGLDAGGAFSDLPVALDGLGLDTRALRSDRSVAGQAGNLVYVLIPVQLTRAQRGVFHISAADTAVLVATRAFAVPTGGAAYFVLVGVGCLLVAGAVAYWLASRFSRPLVTAAQATERIAGGDLDARMATSARDMPEFAALADAINAMADRLEGAREQERQFLLSVSHDLRTPLTSIRGYAEALAEGATDDVAGAVGIIGAEARRLDRLVGDLLDLARLDARRFRLQSEPVDAAEVARRAADRLRPEAEAAGLELVAEVGGAPLWVAADPDRLDQVLANLVENACRFARRHVAVGARPEGRRAVLWVDDDGPGIPPGDLDRVFAPHFTSDRSGARRGGTGLGLAIVAELAAAMGGGTRAESPLGEGGGTRMVVWLPAAAGGPPEGAAPGG